MVFSIVNRLGRFLLCAVSLFSLLACEPKFEQIKYINHYIAELDKVLAAHSKEVQINNSEAFYAANKVFAERLEKLSRHFSQFKDFDDLQLVVEQTNSACFTIIHSSEAWLNQSAALEEMVPSKYELIKTYDGYQSYQKQLEDALVFLQSFVENIEQDVESSRLKLVNSDMDRELKQQTWKGINMLLTSYKLGVTKSLPQLISSIEREMEIIAFLNKVPDQYTVSSTGKVQFIGTSALLRFKEKFPELLDSRKRCPYVWCQ